MASVAKMDLIQEFLHIIVPIGAAFTAISVVGGSILAVRKLALKGYAREEYVDSKLDNPDKGKPGIKQQMELKAKEGRQYTDQEVENLKKYSNEKDEADKKWLNTLQNKVEENGKAVATVTGKVDLLGRAGL